ncbi:unnamed protein product [Rotaria sordida]|uniref:Uncharacterized protein n=1 Tax=Rotaria sordida TaxID=392033 RepID=A0A814KME5_9BILA|nr:unnamed protein product [Rotaria sordida]CAF1054487.1 unnamed protein product [Rotaria sordida]CAF1098209.1 unnamed protein product [Rotaria sordida]CAF3794403.1 unnamed protein product [Rotaria sordida]CAF3827143.1 unnamed protein product [Rotaria sordida]
MSSSTNFKSSKDNGNECIANQGCVVLAVALSLVILLICIVLMLACCKKQHLNRIRSAQCPTIQQNNYNSNSSAPPPYNWCLESPPPPYNQVKV